MNKEDSIVAEISGPYGSIIVPERFIQKLWEDQSFNKNSLFLEDGRKLEIIDPGTINLLEGPDFIGGRIKIEGTESIGDIEVHIYPEDWSHHGHDKDPRYQKIILHVTVFPANTPSAPSPHPHLTLISHLKHSLEEIVCDYAIEELVQNTNIATPTTLNEETIRQHAQMRWFRKVKDAKKRLELSGWDQALHELILENLGTKRNREPMAKIAQEFPYNSLKKNSQITALQLFEKGAPWKLNGIRPAGHPVKRLESYLQWLQNQNANSKEQLNNLLRISHATSINTDHYRKINSLKKLRIEIQSTFFKNIFSENTVNTLTCDVLLPLLNAENDNEEILFPMWYHWFAGNAPDIIKTHAKKLKNTLSNGLIQGVLHSVILYGLPRQN
jgi:hypothetical protein